MVEEENDDEDVANVEDYINELIFSGFLLFLNSIVINLNILIVIY